MKIANIERRLAILIALISLGLSMAAFSQLRALTLPQKPSAEAEQLFAYRSVAFDLKEESVKDQDGVTIRDVNYAAYTSGRGRIKAYLVAPTGKGRCAAILFFHWLGEEKSNRDEFLEEAVALARQGTVSLLIQGYFPWAVAPKDGETDRQRIIDETVEVRRALDLLISQPRVDRKRIGYVGHDYGAMYGAIVSGLEHRVKTFVFMAAMSNFGDWSLKYWPKSAAKGEAAYRLATKAVDPINFVPNAAPAALLFQFSNNDKYISKEIANSYSGVASKPKQVLWYDALHDLNIEAARKDRREWLKRQLGLTAEKSGGKG
jgi:dienelactone hydrolase